MINKIRLVIVPTISFRNNLINIKKLLGKGELYKQHYNAGEKHDRKIKTVIVHIVDIAK